MIQSELVRVIENGIPHVEPAMQPRYAKFVAHLRVRAGDKAFMLDYLSTICDQDHPYFAKDYRPPKRESNFKFEELKVDNSDGFFDGLPISTSKSKRRTTGIGLVVNNQEREQRKLAYL